MSERFIISPADVRHYTISVEPKLAQGKRPYLFFTFTYITPNYVILAMLREIAVLQKKGFHIIIGVWDINTLYHPYTRQFVRINGTKEEYVQQRIEELRRAAAGVGVVEEYLTIYRTSDLWRRFVTCNEPPLLNELYGVLMDMDVEGLDDTHKVSHLIQMPMDVCIASFLHVLCPEDLSKKVTALFVAQDRRALYAKTRELLIERGLLSPGTLIFLYAPEIPLIIDGALFPEWNMDEDEIGRIVSNNRLSSADARRLLEVIVEGDTAYSVVNGRESKTSLSQLNRKLANFSETDLKQTIAKNIYVFLQDCRQRSGVLLQEMPVIRIGSKKDAVVLGRVLRSTVHLDVLSLCDGTNSPTKIARALHKELPNVSVYLKHLRELGIIKYDGEGRPVRLVRGMTFNFDADLH